MSPAYQKGVRENFGNAQIVFDKFHVVSQVTQAVDEVRRAETRQDAQAREQLERTSWLWRKNPESWTAKESDRWVQLKDKPLVTGLAYSMRLELQKAFSLPQVFDAAFEPVLGADQDQGQQGGDSETLPGFWGGEVNAELQSFAPRLRRSGGTIQWVRCFPRGRGKRRPGQARYPGGFGIWVGK